MKNCMQARFCIGLSVFLLLASGSAVLLFSQRNAKKSKNEDMPTYKTTVNVVLVNASVFDKKGNPVKDLNAEDFRIYDEGEPQKIQTFAFESYDPDNEEEQAEQLPASKKQKIEQSSKTRLISFLIDDFTMWTKPAPDPSLPMYFPLVFDSMKKFVETDLKPNDQIAILSASRSINFPFSNDKQKIIDQLSAAFQKLSLSPIPHQRDYTKIDDFEAWSLAMNLNTGMYLHPSVRGGSVNASASQPASSSSPEGASSGQKTTSSGLPSPKASQSSLNEGPPATSTTDDSTAVNSARDEEELINECVIQNANVQYATHQFLAMLSRHIRTLQHFDGQKEIVIFSEGFLSEPQSETKYKVQEAIDLAIRNGIVLNFINPLGPLGDTDRPTNFMDEMARYSTMEQMANYTGGIFENDNGIINAIKKVARRPLYRYAMSYVMPPHKTPGVHQKIKLEVNRPGLTLSYKKGYYFSKEELTFQSNKKEDVLAAVNAPGDMKEIPTNLAYNYSLADDDLTYAVSFLTSVNVQQIKFIQEEERRKNLLHLVLAVFDEAGNYVNGLEKAIDFQLLETSYPAFLSRGIESKVEFKLHPGRYIVKSIVREDNQGKLGSTSKTIDIP